MNERDPAASDEVHVRRALQSFDSLQNESGEPEQPEARNSRIQEARVAKGTDCDDSIGTADGSTADLERGAARLNDLTHKDTQVRFENRKEVARGGMGAILSVYDRDLRRTVAMKVALDGDGAAEGGSSPISMRVLSRFIEEAQVTSQLDHPGIVPVHELGLGADGRAYFTMKLVKGRNLHEILEQAGKGDGDWSQARLLGVLLKVCEAMAYAHDKGVVHRDLKPANIMVGRYGEVYVMDWGLARAEGSPSSHDIRLKPTDPVGVTEVNTDRNDARQSSSESPLITMDGSVVGTPYFMPPEQARGDVGAVGPRSDVYAVGTILYRVLTGQLPYKDSSSNLSPHTVLAMVLHAPPQPIRRIQSMAAPELVSICDKAMARDPQDRYQTIGELAEDLRAWLEGRVVKAHQTGALRQMQKWVARNRALAAALGLALLAVFVGSGVALQQRAVALAKAQSLSLALASESAALTVAEGHRLAAQSLAVGADDPTLALLLATEAGKVSTGINVNRALYAALAIQSQMHIFNGHDGKIVTASVSPDGRLAFSADETHLQFMWDVETRKPLWSVDVHRDLVTATGFCDEGRIVFSSSLDGSVRFFRSSDGTPLAVHELGSAIRHSVPDPGSDRVFAACADGRVVSMTSFSSSDSKLVGEHSGAVIRLDCWAGLLASLGDRHELQILRLADSTVLAKIDVSIGEIMTPEEMPRNDSVSSRLSLNHDGTQVAASRGDMYGALWNIAAQGKLDIPPGSESAYFKGLTPDRRNLVQLKARSWGKENRQIEYWPMDGGPRIARFTGGYFLGFSNDGRSLFRRTANGGFSGLLSTIDRPDLDLLLVGHSRPLVWGAAVFDDELITASHDRTLRLWTMPPAQNRNVSSYHQGFVAGGGERAILLDYPKDDWSHESVESSRSIRFSTLGGGGEDIEILAGEWPIIGDWNRNGEFAWISVPRPGVDRVLVWSLAEQRVILDRSSPIRSGGALNNHYAISDDGQLLAVMKSASKEEREAGGLSSVELVEIQTGDLRREWDFPLALHKPVFSPDGTLLCLTNQADGVATLWLVQDGSLLATLEGHRSWVINANFSPDGKRLATFGVNTPVRVYDTSSFELQSIVPGVALDRGDIAWSPDSSKILVHSSFTLGFHDVDRGQTIADWQFGGEVRCNSAGFSSNGKEIWYYLNDGSMHRYPTDPMARCLEIAPRRLTAEEMKDHGLGTEAERKQRTIDILKWKANTVSLSALARIQVDNGDLAAARKTLDGILARRARAVENLEFQEALHALERATPATE